MKPIYIVCGPVHYQGEMMEKYRKLGYDPIIVSNGVTLRGRICGDIVYEGEWTKLWNIQEIEESIYLFTQRCSGKKEIEETGRDEEFFEYGIDE